MTEVESAHTTVVVEREFDAPIGAVFAAWTDVARMARWFSPTGRAHVEADVRVGGRFRVVMLGDDTRLEHTGEYLAIEPPKRISFTWLSMYTGPNPGVVTVELAERGERTLLRLTHEGLPDSVRESHRDGWSSILARLDDVLIEARDGG